jgi:hypothetical protein
MYNLVPYMQQDGVTEDITYITFQIHLLLYASNIDKSALLFVICMRELDFDKWRSLHSQVNLLMLVIITRSDRLHHSNLIQKRISLGCILKICVLTIMGQDRTCIMLPNAQPYYLASGVVILIQYFRTDLTLNRRLQKTLSQYAA